MKEFIQEFNVNEEVVVGKGSALMFRPDGQSKYSLFLPLESTPFVVGDTETHEYRVTTSRNIGRVAGYSAIDDKEIQFIVTPSFINRLEEYLGKKIDFLSVLKSGIAQQFTAEYTYRIEDAGDDIVRGTIKFIASSVGNPVMDVRDLIMDTVMITNPIPSEVVLATATGSKVVNIETNVVTPTVTVSSNNVAITATYSDGKITITGNNGAGSSEAYGIVKVVVSKTDHASWTYFIRVEAPAGA